MRIFRVYVPIHEKFPPCRRKTRLCDKMQAKAYFFTPHIILWGGKFPVLLIHQGDYNENNSEIRRDISFRCESF